MRASFITVIVASVALLIPTHRSAACSCLQVSPCEAFGSASAVFVGRMLGGTEKHREYSDKGETVSLEAGEVRFAIEESFKGVSATEITITAMNMKGTSCEGMAALARGRRYLVYATDQEPVGLSIGPCSATKRIEDAGADLSFLRNLVPIGSGGRVYGSIAVDTGKSESTPLAKTTVIIEDQSHHRIKIETDQNGNFAADGLKPGKYLVSPVLRDTYFFPDGDQQNRVVQVFDRGCTRVSFWVRAK